MGLFSQKAAVDTRTYETGANKWNQNSRAYLLALIAYMGIFLFGYDTGVAGGIVGLKAFTDDFHYTYAKPTAAEKKRVADISSNVVSLLQAGAFFGALGAAPICQKVGRKYALMLGTTVFSIGAALQTAAMGGLGLMYAGRIISGAGVGLMSTVCPTYVAEMTPKEVRGRITGMFQIIVVIGVAFSYWIEYAISVSMAESTAQWRIPIGFQLVPSGLMLLLLPLIKESPRWLVFKGRNEEGLANLAWVRKRNADDPYVLEEYNEICAGIQEERETTSGASFGECIKPGNRKRFFIAFTMFMLQQFGGQNSISYYAPTIFKSIGITGTSTGLLTSGIYGIVKIFATSLFIFVGIERVGRKRALGFGAAGMSVFLFIIGGIFIASGTPVIGAAPSSSAIAMAAMIYLFVIPYCFSWGPVPWVYCAEIFPMRIRHYGMATAAASQWAFNFTISKLTPYMVNGLPNGKLFFVFAAINVLNSSFGFWLPETKGLSIEEMDVLFGAVTLEDRQRYLDNVAKNRQADTSSINKKDYDGEMEHVEHSASAYNRA